MHTEQTEWRWIYYCVAINIFVGVVGLSKKVLRYIIATKWLHISKLNQTKNPSEKTGKNHWKKKKVKNEFWRGTRKAFHSAALENWSVCYRFWPARNVKPFKSIQLTMSDSFKKFGIFFFDLVCLFFGLTSTLFFSA